MARANWVKIKQYTIDGKHKRTYSSIKKATQVTGINGSHYRLCKGQEETGWRLRLAV